MQALQHSTRRGSQRQGGAVLIVSLLFLMVITLIGVAGMQGTSLQERMAGNMRDRNMAFQAAEAALRGAEAWLDNSISNRLAAEGHPTLAAPINWNGTNPSPAAGQIVMPPAAQLHADPVFHIDPPSFVRQPEAMNLNQAELDCQRVYPVTGRAVGGTNTAVVLLRSAYDPRQSGFVNCPNPD